MTLSSRVASVRLTSCKLSGLSRWMKFILRIANNLSYAARLNCCEFHSFYTISHEWTKAFCKALLIASREAWEQTVAIAKQQTFYLKLFLPWFGHFAWNQPQRKMSARRRVSLMLRAKQFHVLADSDAQAGWLASEKQAAKFNYAAGGCRKHALTGKIQSSRQRAISSEFNSLLSIRKHFRVCSVRSELSRTVLYRLFPLDFLRPDAYDLARWVIAKNKLIRQKAKKILFFFAYDRILSDCLLVVLVRGTFIRRCW